MKPQEKARKILEDITAISIPVSISASEGGKCSDGYCDEDACIDLEPEEIRYLLKDKVNASLMEGLETKEIDVDATMADMAEESCYPDGLAIRLHLDLEETDEYCEDDLPEELGQLYNELKDAEDDYDAFVAKLKEIKAQKCTFIYGVVSGDGFSEFSDYNEATIELSKAEITSLMLIVLDWEIEDEEGVETVTTDGSEMMELISDKITDENDIYDETGYTMDYSYEGLENYVEALAYLINGIADGSIDDEKHELIEHGYFDNTEYENEMTIKDWLEEQGEE